MYINLIHYVSGTGSVPGFWLTFSKKKLKEASLKTTYPVPEKYFAKIPYVRPGLAKFNLTSRAQNSLRTRPGFALVYTYIAGAGDWIKVNAIIYKRHFYWYLLKLPWYALQTCYIVYVKWYYWNYSGNEARRYFLRGWDDGINPLVKEFWQGLCVVSINKTANKATDRSLACHRNTCGGFMIPLFFDIWRNMTGSVRLCNFLSSTHPLKPKCRQQKKKISTFVENCTAY